MSERENFLARWSARKLANRTEAPQDAAAQPPRDPAAQTIENTAVAETPNAPRIPENEASAPAQLPSLDSIGADSSVAAFLRPDVPAELTRAALRRAWTSDPAIKNFVGLVENGWDFNDPSAMPGFGTISPEDVARLAGRVIAALPPAAPEEQAKDALSTEKESSVASTGSLPGPLEVTPEAAKPESTDGYDAAQQNGTDKTS